MNKCTVTLTERQCDLIIMAIHSAVKIMQDESRNLIGKKKYEDAEKLQNSELAIMGGFYIIRDAVMSLYKENKP